MATVLNTTQSSTRTISRWLWYIAIIYIHLVLISYIFALPIRYQNLLANPTLTPALAGLQLGMEYLVIVVASIIGIYLVLKRNTELIAVLMSVTMIVALPNIQSLSYFAVQLHAVFHIPSALAIIGLTSLVLYLFICLPDGYPHSRLFFYLIGIILIYDILRYIWLFAFAPANSFIIRQFAIIPNLICLLAGLILMIRRYRLYSTPTQRQQFKWLFWGLTIEGIIVLANHLLTQFIIIINGDFAMIRVITTFTYALGGITVCIALLLAISRYGLWNVDLTINRSLVGGFVTVSLIILFGIIFWIVQVILDNILGTNQTEIAMTISALVVGVVFNPTSSRVRTFVDRRLYGFRFDLNQLQRHKEKADVITPGALTGQVLGGYELLDVIGRGGMGEVYKGYADGQYVAIKILQTMHTNDDIMRQRFMREGKITLSHKNIVQTLGAGEKNGVFFILIEYVEGQTLKELLAERPKLALADIKTYLHDLAGAIDYAHVQGYVHRDIKPSNIMLRRRDDNETYEVVLMDFGIAKFLDETGSLTGSAAVGTIDYMAPEQIMDSTTVDYRADIYALGVVLYEVLTGTLPFKGTLAQVLFAHINQPAPDIRQIMPDIGADISLALQRALQKDPNDRFQSATEFVKALTSHL